jgi:hypothetical protein
MAQKDIIITEKSGKKHERTIREEDNPVTVEYAINCSALNYSDAVLREIDRLKIHPDDVLCVKYKEDVEKYEPGQGPKIKNRL